MRLGQTSDVEIVNSQRYRVKQGQALWLESLSFDAALVRAWARVRYDNGEDDILFIPDQTLNSEGTRALAIPSDVARHDGWVTDALVELPIAADDIKRGQVYVRLYLDPFGPLLCKDYCYSDFGQVPLGTFIQSGPGGGDGNLRWVAVKADGVPATFSYNLRTSNTIRLVRQFIWYYAASNTVASRLLQAQLRRAGAGLPTGYSTGSEGIVWEATDLTLTSDQDGSVFADSHRSGINDAGVLAIDNAAAEPPPFPLLVTEDDLLFFRFLVTNEEADDFDLVWGLFEDWVVV